MRGIENNVRVVNKEAIGENTEHRDIISGNPHDVTLEEARSESNVIEGDINFNENSAVNIDSIQFMLNSVRPCVEGELHWHDDDGTLSLGMPGGDVSLQIGLEGLIRVSNKSGAAILNGNEVYVTGSQGNRLTIGLADNTDANKMFVLGMATEDIANNGSGWVALWGDVRGSTEQPIDTSTFAEGDKLYLNSAGGWTNVHPTSSVHGVVIIGRVRKVHATEGIIYLTTAQSFTIGNEFDGTIRQSVMNKSTGASAAAGFTAVNDNNHFTTFGIAGSGNTTFPNEVSIFYAPGYGDHWQAVDGSKDFVWFTDPTDSHNNSALNYERMRLEADGTLSVGADDYELLVTEDDDIPNRRFVTNFTDKMFLNGYDRYDTTSTPDVTFSSGTMKISVAVQGGESDFSFWANNTKYTKTTTQEVTVPSVTGAYYAYFDGSGVLQVALDSAATLEWFTHFAITALIYWNESDSSYILSPDEMHGIDASGIWHFEHHLTEGAQLHAGAEIEGLSDASPTYTQSTASLAFDEDIPLSVAANAVGHKMLYRFGADGAWRQTAADLAIGHIEGGDTYYSWNENNGGTWQWTEGAPTTDFWITFFLLAPAGVFKIAGQNAYATRAAARDAIETEVTNIETDGLPMPETIWLGAVICTRSGDLQDMADGSVFYSLAKRGAGTQSVSGTTVYAEDVPTSVTSFDGILSAADVNVQLALDTIDNFTHNAFAVLQGGTTGEYYHLTDAELTKLGGIEALADVTDATNVLAAGAVMTTGNQSVAGVKTFSSFSVTPSSAPTTDYQVANKKYVDDNGGGGGATEVSVNQVAHGFTVGTPIYNASGTWTKAKSDAEDTLGICFVTAVADVDNFTYIGSGIATITTHGYTVGEYYFVDASTAGTLTATEPTGLTEYSRPAQALIRSNDQNVTAVTTTPYAALDTDELINVDATAASAIVNLKTPSATYDGYSVTVKKINSSANTVTLKSSSGNIDGILGTIGIVISTQYNSRTVVCDGTDYWIL